MPAFNQNKTTECQYVIALDLSETSPGLPTPRFVSTKPLDWITTRLDAAKLFKTTATAAKWLADRPEVKGRAIRVEVTRVRHGSTSTGTRVYEIALDPEVYLSVAEGMWTVIDQGQPLCASTPDRARAEAVAARFKLPMPMPIWRGDEGRFDLNT